MKLKNLHNIILIEIRDFFNKKNLLLILATIIIFNYFIQIGIVNYNHKLDSNINFIKSEKLKSLKHNTLTMYASYGIFLNSIPNKLSFLASSSGFSNLMGFVDNGSRMYVIEDKKGKNIDSKVDFFKAKFIFYLWGIYLGFFLKKEYLNQFISIIGKRKAFFTLLISKGILLLLLLIFIFSSIIVQLTIYKLLPISSDFFIIALLLFLTSLVFLLFSLAIKFLILNGSKYTYIFLLSTFLILFCTPYILDELKNNYDNYKNEIEEVSELMKFEAIMEAKFGKSKVEKSNKPAPQEIKNEIERWRKEGGANFYYLENGLIDKTINNVKKYHLFSIFFPTSFMNISLIEISSHGLRSKIDFHKFILKSKNNFVNYYLDSKFYSGNQKEKIPYKGENFYHLVSYKPFYFFYGILILIFYLGIGILSAYYSYVSLLKSKIEIDLNFKSAVINYFLTRNDYLKRQVFNNAMSNYDFFYLPPIPELPQKFNIHWCRALEVNPNLVENTPWKIFLQAALNSSKIIIGQSFLLTLKDNDIKYIEEKLRNNNAIFLEIGDDRYQWENSGNQLCQLNDKSIEISKFNDFFKED